MRHNRIVGEKKEFIIRVHGFGDTGVKADALVKFGVCFLDRGVRIPNGHVISTSYFSKYLLEERPGSDRDRPIVLTDETRREVEGILEMISGEDQVFRSSFRGDLAGNGIYTTVFAPLKDGVEAIEKIITDAAGEDARDFRKKRGLDPDIAVLIMRPVLDSDFDCPLLAGCGFTKWGDGMGRLAIVSGLGTRATSQTAFIANFDFKNSELPDDLRDRLTNQRLNFPERLLDHRRVVTRSEDGFAKKLLESAAYLEALEMLPDFLRSLKAIEGDIGPFYFEFACARRVREIGWYALQVAPYKEKTLDIMFPAPEPKNVILTNEVAGRCERVATSIVSTLEYDVGSPQMHKRMLELNKDNTDYILVVHDIHSAMIKDRWLSYACFSNAVAIVEVNPNHQHKTPSEHFRGLLRDSKIPFLHIDWLRMRTPFRIQELSEFRLHTCRATVLVDDCAVGGPKGAIVFEELPVLDRPQDLPEDDGYSR